MAKKTTKRMPKRREEYTYHGYTIEQLKAMSMDELLPIMPSGARREPAVRFFAASPAMKRMFVRRSQPVTV